MIRSATFRRSPPRFTPAPAVDIARLQADFSRQVNEAVVRAVAESDAKHEERTAELLAVASKRFEAQLKAERQMVSQNFDVMARYNAREVRALMESR